MCGRELLQKGLKKIVGNGRSSRVWIDLWLYENGMRVPLIRNRVIDLNLMVCDLIDVDKRDWKIDKVERPFYQKDIEIILAKRLVVNREDFWCWQHNKSGEYTIRSGYWLFNQIDKAELIKNA